MSDRGYIERPLSSFHRPIDCADASELKEQVVEWNGDFAQLSAGPFSAIGGLTQLGVISMARFTFDQTVLNRSYAPRNTVAFLFPGRGSAPAYVRGREVRYTQGVAMTQDACCEAITHGPFVVVAAAIDLDCWNAQSSWLHTQPVADTRGPSIVSQAAWLGSLESSIAWILDAVTQYPAAFTREDVRASLVDRFVATLSNIDGRADTEDATRRGGRARRHRAVERAREYIRENLSEQIRLSDLCNHCYVQSRSLEYGFREMCGLSPVAYIKAVKLSRVRKSLLSAEAPLRSISEIACDYGFWHLSQFAVDYRRFFGETPSATRERARAAFLVKKSPALERFDALLMLS
jgi:AraC family transcriptional regulator, ethanolamine operon transcriptional activator